MIKIYINSFYNSEVKVKYDGLVVIRGGEELFNIFTSQYEEFEKLVGKLLIEYNVEFDITEAYVHYGKFIYESLLAQKVINQILDATGVSFYDNNNVVKNINNIDVTKSYTLSETLSLTVSLLKGTLYAIVNTVDRERNYVNEEQ